MKHSPLQIFEEKCHLEAQGTIAVDFSYTTATVERIDLLIDVWN